MLLNKIGFGFNMKNSENENKFRNLQRNKSDTNSQQ